MVKKRYLCIGSVCIHGLLAFSVGPYIHGTSKELKNTFSVILLKSVKSTGVKANVTSQKNSMTKAQKQSSPSIKSLTENTTFVPIILHNPAPIYPDSARASGQEGIFSIKLVVSPSGNVEHIEIVTIKGNKEFFEEELLKAIKNWKFNSCGKQMVFEIPISFQLDE